MASPRLLQTAVEAGRRAIAPIVESVARFGPVPKTFWRDPYVLGYLAGMGGLAGRLATKGKLGHRDLTRAALRAIAAFAGRHPREVREAVESGSDLVHAEFEDGFFAAAKVVATLGGLDEELMRDEDVRKALEFAVRNKAQLDESDVGKDQSRRVTKILEIQLFFGYVVAEYYPHVGPSVNSPLERATSTAAE
jgi:hypothetical protein